MTEPFIFVKRVTGEKQAQDHLRRIPLGIRRALIRAVTIEAVRVQGRMQQKLAGEVLKERTHHLHDSIHHALDESDHAVTATVGTDVVYAAFHEYGFHGVEQVRASMRRVTQAFGRPISPIQVQVRAHQRRVDYPAHSFARSTLREMAAEIRDRLEAAVQEGVGGAP